MKPLNKKAYGSIPHIRGSKAGPADHYCSEGQERIATQKTRDKHDFVIVQVKYDGSNVCIAKHDGDIIALTRSGYLAETSPYEQHKIFAKWVSENAGRFSLMIGEGDRLCGEWLLQAHGTRYKIDGPPFIAFDIFKNNKRLCFADFMAIADEAGLYTPRPLAFGSKAYAVEEMLERAKDQKYDNIRSDGPPEGIIYRVERNGEVDFLLKYVRPDFTPGKYLPEISGKPPVWNYTIIFR